MGLNLQTSLLILLGHSSNPLLCLRLDLLPRFIIPVLRFPRAPSLEPSLRPLRLQPLDLDHPLEEAPHKLLITLVDLQIKQLVPDIQALGISGDETLEDGSPALGGAVR
jgi:hypothetical protein